MADKARAQMSTVGCGWQFLTPPARAAACIGSPLRTRLSRQRPPSMRALRAGRERASLLGRPSPLRTPLSGRPCALWPCGPVTLRTRPQRGVMCSKKHPHMIHNGLMLHHNPRKPTEVTHAQGFARRFDRSACRALGVGITSLAEHATRKAAGCRTPAIPLRGTRASLDLHHLAQKEGVREDQSS